MNRIHGCLVRYDVFRDIGFMHMHVYVKTYVIIYLVVLILFSSSVEAFGTMATEIFIFTFTLCAFSESFSCRKRTSAHAVKESDNKEVCEKSEKLDHLTSHVIFHKTAKISYVFNARQEKISDTECSDYQVNHHQVVKIVTVSTVKVGLK